MISSVAAEGFAYRSLIRVVASEGISNDEQIAPVACEIAGEGMPQVVQAAAAREYPRGCFAITK